MSETQLRRQALLDALASRVVIIDGAMGSILQAKLKIEDYGGAQYENCVDNVNRVRPDLIADVHRQYLDAGADIVETNTFNGHPISLAEFHLGDRVAEVNQAAARIARQEADRASKPGRPRWVAGSMGPTTRAISVLGNVTFDELRDGYCRQAKALVEGGVDILLLETCNDARAVKAGLLGFERLFDELGDRYPVMVSATIETIGTMLAGQSIDAFCASIRHANLLSIGLNCGTGPEFMTDRLRTVHDLSPARVSCYPNAGLPLEDGTFPEGPDTLALQLERFIDSGWINIVGGCCGTTPAHIARIAQMAAGKAPRAVPAVSRRALYSGIDMVEADESNRPLIVGERSNVIGSRAFKNLINAEKWEEAAEIARRQVRNGAHVVDVCLQQSERDEKADIPKFYGKLIALAIKAPVMIDTTDASAVELSLTYCQGKAIINSINLEDGEEKFERLCPIARAYGAALVVGTIDEDKLQAQAFTRERKLAIAERSFHLLTTKYGIAPEDIVFDPLVFPCATGDENYIGGAAETVEGVRLIKERIPHVKTVLGVSNISFGLPAAAREVVNSVFLYHCTKAGLDLAIVNAEKLERFASIPAHERQLAENLLFNLPAEGSGIPVDWRQQSRDQKVAVNQANIAAIAEHYRGASAKEKPKKADLPLDERLANYIIEGSKEGLVEDLERKRAEGMSPLDIINGPLMAGMTEVGRLFNNNELIVAEVLQSAEAMKAAVNHLEGFMEKAESAARGKVVLATVKGDVHDIGKNLVEIILANNGYTVVNLGIKVPPEDLIEAWRKHRPDAIGVSGLLVKSAQQMVATAHDFRAAGVQVPLLVGGAALSEKFTNGKIGPAYGAPTFYAKDAMTGLALMNRIMDPATRDAALESHVFTQEVDFGARHEEPVLDPGSRRSGKVRTDVPIPAVPYADRRVRLIANLTDVWSYINPFMLYGRHLGYKGRFEQDLADRNPTALALYHDVEEVKREAAQFMKVRAVWRYFETERDGNSVQLFEAGAASPIHTFAFGRQLRENGLCLSDYVLPNNGRRDSMALFVVTAGEEVRRRSEEAKEAGQFLKAHAIQAIAIETAEGAAEYLHRRIREDWGFPDPDDMTMQQRFTSRYRGKRYSFGYPACPNLDDQQGIWKLLSPGEIGVELTEGMMMEPEASVSALVFHHPDCAYFTAGSGDGGGE
jgi:5-methyltetrahydrofolate--homocysteine methyltransferase